jgi:thermitase
MFSSLYPLAYILCLISLTKWFYFRENPQRSAMARKLFYITLTAFLVSWLFGEASFSYKMLVLGRELLVLAVVPVVLSLFRKKLWAFVLVLVLTTVAFRSFYYDALSNTFPQQAETSGDIALDGQGELLAEIREGSGIADIQGVLEEYGLAATPAFSPKDKAATDLDDYVLINVPPKFEHQLPKVKKALEATGVVEWIEENEQITVAPIEAQRPTPRINKKYGINDPGLEYQWGFEAMNMDQLYDFLKNKKPVKKALLAILDTGVDAAHEDLQANFISTQAKYDYDKSGHGTHCAGIAAAVSNNNKGIASFSQNNEFVQVTSIKVLSDAGYGSQKMIIDGILEAADNGANVISLSLGGPSSDSKQRAYKKAVDYANRKGAIVLVAAGNSKTNARRYAPANTAGVIAVSAVDTLLGRANFSNFVQDLGMAVAAPGVKIYATFPGNQYKTLNGTSMATPYVSGLVGLMKSFKPSLTTEQVFGILNKTGLETKDKKETGHLIQPAAAVRELLK